MDDVRPIIIKKKKVVAGHGHHGGAWKVAYADFVTAMMAFFLLMWLLNATTEEQRKGIADYFNPNIPIAAVSGGGADALAGDSIFTDDKMAQKGIGATQDNTDTPSQRKLEDKAAALSVAIAQDDAQLSEHVNVKMSPEGLVIELVDRDDAPLFAFGSASPSDTLTGLAAIVTDVFSDVDNDIKIVGHTDSFSFARGSEYTNWDLSADRANTARRLLARNGYNMERVVEVAGRAHMDPVDKQNPRAASNRRIALTVLR